VTYQRVAHFADGANRVEKLVRHFRIAADGDWYLSRAELGNHAELAGQERRQSASIRGYSSECAGIVRFAHDT
jgi:hypothetical protein